MQRALRLFAFLLLPMTLWGQAHSFPALDTDNNFTGTNNFQAITATSIADSSLPAGRCVQTSTGGLLVVTAGACGSGGGGGSVSSVSSGNLSPLFTVSIANPTSTPAFTFTLSNASAHTFFGNNTGVSAIPAFSSIGVADLPFTYLGNTTELATVTGAFVPGNCVKTDASGNLVDNGTTCAVSPGTGDVFQSPLLTQSIVQPAGTQFSVNNQSNVRYVTPSYNWSQAPAGTVSAGANTISLTPCPPGILTGIGVLSLQPWTWIHLGTVGTPEDVLVTATTCTQQGGTNGTVTFTAANAHGAGYRAGSSSMGIQEACNAAMTQNTYAAPATRLSQGTCVLEAGREYTITAPVGIKGGFISSFTFDGNNAVLLCQVSGAPCFIVGDLVNQNAISNVTLKNLIPKAGISANTAPFLEDNAQHTTIEGLSPTPHNNSGPIGASFGYLIQLDDDESMVVKGLVSNQYWSRCDATFCSSAVYNPPGKPGILWLKDSVLSSQCTANGVDLRGGNGGHRITDTVVQGYPQFGVRAISTFGTSVAIGLTNVYEEVGNCTNPLGLGQAGVITTNGIINQSPSGPTGNIPRYANTGATEYDYYIVSRSNGSVRNYPHVAGFAMTNGAGSITVIWPQFNTTNTVSYDVLRTPSEVFPYTAVCGGGTPTTCGSVALTLLQSSVCTGGVCTFVDNAAANTSAYTVVAPDPNVSAALLFWPGSVVATPNADVSGASPSGTVMFDQMPAGGSFPVAPMVSANGPVYPAFIALSCPMGNFGTYARGEWIACLNGTHGSTPNPAATLFEPGYANQQEANDLKGIINLIRTQYTSATPNHGHLITLLDSNPAKTFASLSKRPSNDANDSFIGIDNGNQITNSGISFGAPVSLSQYIGNIGDGTSWLERLTSTLKSFKVPITTVSQYISTLPTGTAPISVISSTPVAHLTTVPTTYARSGTQLVDVHIVRDRCTLGTDCAVTLTGAAVFTSSSTYDCIVSNRTAANAVMFNPTSGSAFTLTGTGSDTLSYVCVGN